MLKNYLRERNISIYSLAGRSGVAYSTLNDLANGKVEIDQCRIGMLKAIADSLQLNLNEAYDICCDGGSVAHTSYGIDVSVSVRNKSYHADFIYDGEPVDIRLCRVREETSYYIEEIAGWRAEEYIRNRRLEEWE